MTRSRRKPPSQSSPLERYRNEIDRCVRCGICRAVCPPFRTELLESQSARGRMALIKAVLDGKLAISDCYRDRLASCTACLACETSCPSAVPVTTIIQIAREQAVEECGRGLIGAAVSSVLKSSTAMRSLAWLAPVALRYAPGHFGSGEDRRIASAGKPFLASLKRREGGGRRRGRVAFFVGCAANYFQQDIARSAVAVLEKLGYEVVIPAEQACCGRPLLSLGDREGAAELAARNVPLFTGLNVDAVVTVCPSCALTFQREYPTLHAPQAGFPPVRDIHELIADSLEQQPLGAVKGPITWHEPCHLGRGLGLGRKARQVLNRLPEAELLEMRNADQCCGFGGVMRLTQHGLSSRIGAQKAKDAIRTGAAALVTGCPGCMLQIRDALRAAGSDIRVEHTVQILERAMKGAK